MGGIKYLVPWATLLVCVFAKWGTKEEYQSGPLPNLRLRKEGFDLKKVVMRAESSPGPCLVCCRQRRAFERSCRRVEELESDLTTVDAEITQTIERLTAAQATITRSLNALFAVKRRIARNVRRVARLQTDLLQGGNSREERLRIRAQIQSIRPMTLADRNRAEQLRAQVRRREIIAEDLAADIELLRIDRRDEMARIRRASRDRDRVEATLNRCLARTNV